ncbi:MAG: DUF4350 domain-containing protein [Parasphingorhabdus sp.]|uniref:DUF4350 domain-containing protein n=1 Tax=Parasphingorhabdus sp. TaxID=2709688 RepID=UPI0030027A92
MAAFGFALLAVMGLLLQCSPAATNAPDNASAPIQVQLMTSLPIIWGDGASMESILSGKTSPAPIYSHWQKNYNITAVDSFEGLENSGTDIVLLAQPPAMDPADIAAIDAWVRAGGKVIILTDPMLVWPTALPLGDKRRPLASGLLSPLLSHWGLALQMPDATGSGRVELEFPQATVSTVGIGTFKPIAEPDESHAECALSIAHVMVRCKVGQGAAIILADADFLNDNLWADKVRPSDSGASQLIDLFVADLRK